MRMDFLSAPPRLMGNPAICAISSPRREIEKLFFSRLAKQFFRIFQVDGPGYHQDVEGGDMIAQKEMFPPAGCFPFR